MATEKELIDREKEVTDKVSTQVRTLSAGLIVFTWGIFNAAERTAASRVRDDLFPLIILIDVFAVIALCADLAQYVTAKRVVEKAFREPRNVASGDYLYDDEWLEYRAQNWLFVGKLWACGGALVLTAALAASELIFEALRS